MTPGQAAYEAWRHLIIPPVTLPWDALPSDEARDGWEKVAEAARSAEPVTVKEA